ncbi:unnamed protein product, partial [Prorocentrum cordatum]
GREKGHGQMEEFQVFDRAPKNFAKGKRVRRKWVDDERCDDDGRESVRARFVAMQFAWDARGDTFAGAPPLAAFRLVVSFASSLYSAGTGCDGTLGIYVVPPKRKESEGIVYQLKWALYGTRRASFLFQKLTMEVMDNGGFVRITVTVQVYYHKERLLIAIVHGGGVLAGGRRGALDWLGELVRGHFTIKVMPRVGSPRQGRVEPGSFLKCTVTWCPEGFGITHDRKHVEVLASTMPSRKTGESNATKRAITAPSRTIGKDCRESSDEPSTEYATTYCSTAHTALYVAHDRFDIQQAVAYLMRAT